MDLYFSPLAGSLAARIALYEAGAEARFIEVDPKTKRTPDGSNFAAIYPRGLVPLLRLDDGSLLSENAAILQFIGNRFPESNLAPTDEFARARLQQWLSFIGTTCGRSTAACSCRSNYLCLIFLPPRSTARDLLAPRSTFATKRPFLAHSGPGLPVPATRRSPSFPTPGWFHNGLEGMIVNIPCATA